MKRLNSAACVLFPILGPLSSVTLSLLKALAAVRSVHACKQWYKLEQGPCAEVQHTQFATASFMMPAEQQSNA